MLLLTTETRRAQREFFLPDWETAIGQEIIALWARSSNRVALCQRLDPGSRAFSASGGSFPWPSSPGQGKINFLCVLCASVVNLQSGLLRPLKCGGCIREQIRLEVAKGKFLDHLQWGRGRLRLGEVVNYLRRPRTHLLTSILWYSDVVLPISSIWSPHEGPPGVSFQSISPGLRVAHFCWDTINFRSPCRRERR